MRLSLPALLISLTTALAYPCLSGVGVTEAAAQPAAPPGASPSPLPSTSLPQPSASARATEYFDKGTALLKQSRFAEAEAMFQAAWDLKQGYDIAANLGDCELMIGQMSEAATHLAFALREFPITGKDAVRLRVQARLGEARAAVGALRVRVSEDGAEVIVDGRSVGRSPLLDDVFVEPGARSVEAKLAGHAPARASIEIAKGASRDVSLTLVPALPPGVDAGGQGGAGGRGGAGGISGDSGGASSKSLALLVTGGAVTAAALITGIGLTVGANGKASDADARISALSARGEPQCPALLSGAGSLYEEDCAALRGLRESQSTLSNAAVAVFVIGGVVAGATLTYALWPERSKTSRGVDVRPVPAVTTTSGGLWVTGRF